MIVMANNFSNNGNIFERMGKKLLTNKDYQAYFFKFSSVQQSRVAGIRTLGWQKRDCTAYHWHGLKRPEAGCMVFQYTLHGEGEIEIDGKVTRLKPGMAFFVDIPSDHRYYFPDDSESWEFIYITLFGEEIERNYKEMVEAHGHIFHLEEKAKPIQQIVNLYSKVVHNQIKTAFESSSYAYSFMMQLQQYMNDHLAQVKSLVHPESVTRGVQYIHHHYNDPITLDDIVEEAGISKYYFSRQSKDSLDTTPMTYLTKIRMEKSMEFLSEDKMTVEEIAQQVGYANGNYFSKVFRSIIGISPGRYRESQSLGRFENFAVGD